VATEVPVALTYNRATHAVMLASPSDLADFALGFSLSEGIITHPDQIEALDIVPLPEGIEARMDLAADRLDRLTRRQRRLAGPSGCGLCGLDSLAEAVPTPPRVPSGPAFPAAMIAEALRQLRPAQTLNEATRAAHAAGFWHPDRGMVALREDIGRHNALDKLIGALARQNIPGHSGILLLTSRVSVELIQKTAILGCGVIVAISAPTTLAIAQAEAAGITLIGIARDDGFELFTHPERVQP
jgi:FdhD protein